MADTITFTASLVRKGELMTSKNGKNESKYMYITVVRNYQKYNSETEKYEDVGQIYQDCSLNGKTAENFDKSNPSPGALLIIRGRLNYVPENTYTNKNGEEINNPARESVLVDDIGLSFSRWQVPQIEEKESNSKNKTKSSSTKRTTKKSETVEKQNDILNKDDLFSEDTDLVDGFETDDSDDIGFDDLFPDL